MVVGEAGVRPRILVIQTFRYGDVIQSTPAIAALRRHSPDAEITALARKPFGEVLRGNPDIDLVVELDTNILDSVGHVPGAPADEQLETLRGQVGARLSPPFDEIINLANDFPSALVVALLKPQRASGLVLCPDGRYRVRNEWLRYLFMAAEARFMAGINLADILSGSCGGSGRGLLKMPVTAADRHWAEETLGATLRAARAPVAIQAGASKDYKRWPPGRFAAVSRMLLDAGHPLVFVGSESERPLAATILGALPASPGRVADIVGRTTFSRLAAVLERCRLLISNDTATVHVAAAVGTPSLVITFGPTSAWETAPYGEGHYVLEPAAACFPCDWEKRCPDMPCRDMITADVVWRAAMCALGPPGLHPGLEAGPATLYRTAWMPDGLLGLEPLNKPELEIRDVLRAIMRTYFVSHRLRRAGVSSGPEWRPWCDEMLRWYRVKNSAALRERASAAAADMAALGRLAQAGRRAAEALMLNTGKAPDPSVQRLCESVSRLEERILASEENELLRFLVVSFRHALRDMEPMSPDEAALAHRWNFMDLANACAYAEEQMKAFSQFLSGQVEHAAADNGRACIADARVEALHVAD